MKKKKTINKIIKLRKQGRTIRWIAKKLGISKTTVVKYLKEYELNQRDNSQTKKNASKKSDTKNIEPSEDKSISQTKKRLGESDTQKEDAINELSEDSLRPTEPTILAIAEQQFQPVDIIEGDTVTLIPPFESTSEWLTSFLTCYGFNRSFVNFQVRKMKENFNVLPSVNALKKDIDEMDSGITTFQWAQNISKMYAKYLPALSYPSIALPSHNTPYLGSEPFYYPFIHQEKNLTKEMSVKTDTEKTKESTGGELISRTKDVLVKTNMQKGGTSVNDSVPSGNPVNSKTKKDASVKSDTKAIESSEGESPSQTEEVLGESDTQKENTATVGSLQSVEDSDINESESGSLWPVAIAAVIGATAIGGVILARHLKGPKDNTQIQKGEKVTTCPRCKNKIIYNEKYTDFFCPCGAYLFLFQCQQCRRMITYDENCTRINCTCGISMNIEPCPSCQGYIIYDTRYADLDCPICGVNYPQLK